MSAIGKPCNMTTGFVYVIRDMMGNVIESNVGLIGILIKGHNLLLMNPNADLTVDYGNPDDLCPEERAIFDTISDRQIDPTLAKDEPLPCKLTWDLVNRMDDFAYYRKL